MLDTLPLELATEIFISTLDSDISDERLVSQLDAEFLLEDGRVNDRPSPTSGPLLLAQICQAWRRVALSTPQLWSNLVLCEAHASNPNLALIEQWLERAPLVSLSVWANPIPDTILDLISRHRTKWKVLTFQCLGGSAFELSRINPAGGFPSLRELVINKSDQGVNTIQSFRDAPQLQEFHLLGCFSFLTAIRIPWAQITHFSCSIPSVDATQFLHILKSTPNLVCAVFRTTSWSPGNMIPPLLRLKSLTLTSHELHGFAPATVLRYLTLPALQTLHVGITGFRHSQIEMLLAFLTRSSCQLVSFAVVREALLEPFIPCLEAMPTVSSLRLTILSSEEDGSQFLQRLRDDASFLPRLEDLTIVSNGRLLFPYDLLLETIRARTGLVQLRRFALLWTSHPGRFYSPDAPLERQLRETGVDIHFGPYDDVWP
ncbi:hypothetical protein B0H16DRAFT_1512372 [Mycena metata]|uniref:F-box domain-containing protein n=1 Tax=Mycena metata TaxID=1033252 RepID=A0AAD7JZ54_9AGAR|nr:hypothetical protein B0H16DRAFT_1512372 [Mycena metata]